MIIQCATREVGKTGWFTAYAILGDDVVIANCLVALRYRDVLKGLGVRIPIAKTLRVGVVVSSPNSLGA
jgi:hypothetical protein